MVEKGGMGRWDVACGWGVKGEEDPGWWGGEGGGGGRMEERWGAGIRIMG